MMLLTLSLLMGAGILIPGYLKMRGIELNEAIEYTRDRSIGMREELERAASVLKKAGVGDIQSYVDSSKAGIVDRYRLAQPDVRINKIILDSGDSGTFSV